MCVHTCVCVCVRVLSTSYYLLSQLAETAALLVVDHVSVDSVH